MRTEEYELIASQEGNIILVVLYSADDIDIQKKLDDEESGKAS